ncbi:MAG: hypothetical protein M3R47_10485 [Chloroflexota bacterium]|nr:hypothetical protein [Chloroflexota bacterium]
MENAEIQFATEKLTQLRTDYQVDVSADWGAEADGAWKKGNWSKDELERLHRSIELLAGIMGRRGDKFIQNLGGVKVEKADMGSHGGEALAHNVRLSSKGSFSAWTVVHEFAHAWDANHDWKLSVALEKYTGGSTRPILSRVKRLVGLSDTRLFTAENRSGRRGRKPGCNAAGYFYGDKPSGSNWRFDRREDFAEAVTMYVGWGRNNDLSNWAEARIKRYLLENGTTDKNFGKDHWTYYSRYFYPPGGDYTKTKRWKFVEELVKGRIKVS